MFTNTTLGATRVSRRSLLKAGLGGAVALGLAAPGLSALGGPTFRAAATLPFQAYHNATGAVHQTKFDTLSAQGYRMISLSISGDPNDPRYAAVWVQRPGSAFIAMHGINEVEYIDRYNAATAQGYAPVLLSATGPANNIRYAAVFEQGITSEWISVHKNPYYSDSGYRNGWVDYLTAMREAGFFPRSITIFGDPATAGKQGELGLPPGYRFAAVFHKSVPAKAPWLFSDLVTANTYQTGFDDATSRGYQPGALAVSFDTKVAGVFTSAPQIGGWEAHHNLTDAQYQQAFNTATAKGLTPIHVQAGGVGAGTRYAAVFAAQVP